MLFLALAQAHAEVTIQRQVDPETGTIIFSYRPSSEHGKSTRISPPPAPQAAPKLSPSQTITSSAKPAESKLASLNTPMPGSLRDYPRISAATQKERDSERRSILKQELAWEEQKLAEAAENKAASEVLQGLRANIDALNREIRNTQ